MGGIGSGARRTTNVGNVEDVLGIDIRALRRLGALRPGECVITPVRWEKHALSGPRGRLRIDLGEAEYGGTMMVTVQMPGGQVVQRIAIQAVPAPLGGHRCYFTCPITSRRCEVLYYLNGRFASRGAQHLSYSVQSMSELSRARRKVRKLNARLEGSSGYGRLRGGNRIIAIARMRTAQVAVRGLWHEELKTST